MCHWAIWIQNKAESAVFLCCVICLTWLKAVNWSTSKCITKVHTHTFLLSSSMKLLFETRRWLYNQAGQAENIEMQYSNFFLDPFSSLLPQWKQPIPVSNVSGFTIPLLFLLPPKSFFLIFFFFYYGRAKKTQNTLMALTGFSWSQLLFHCWFHWDLLKSKYKVPGRSFP